MACIMIKKVLGYELCVLEKEGTLFYSDPIMVIRKASFTELYNLQKKTHERRGSGSGITCHAEKLWYPEILDK